MWVPPPNKVPDPDISGDSEQNPSEQLLVSLNSEQTRDSGTKKSRPRVRHPAIPSW